MKILNLIATTLFSFCSLAGSVSFTEIEGRYKVSHPQLPIENIVELKSNGDVTLSENSPFGSLVCEGKASIEGTLLESVVICENGLSFSQIIDFDGVDDFNKFTAPVFSSLYEAEVVMFFERLEN